MLVSDDMELTTLNCYNITYGNENKSTPAKNHKDKQQ